MIMVLFLVNNCISIDLLNPIAPNRESAGSPNLRGTDIDLRHPPDQSNQKSSRGLANPTFRAIFRHFHAIP